jgi:hypothetical protein
MAEEVRADLALLEWREKSRQAELNRFIALSITGIYHRLLESESAVVPNVQVLVGRRQLPRRGPGLQCMARR